MKQPTASFSRRSTALTGVGLASLLAGAPALPAHAADPVVLPDVVVTATRAPEPVETVGSAISVITAEELEQRQTRVLSDALRTVPGLSVTRTAGVGGATEVYIRGAASNQTLVLIDGIEANDPAVGSTFDFGHLLTTGIGRVEVLRGPQSTLYGSDAAGGVVQLLTKTGEDEPGVSATIEGGSYGTGLGSASFSGAGERYRYFVNGTVFHTDGISEASEARGNSERDAYDNKSALAKLTILPSERLDISLIGRITDIDREADDFVGGIGAVDADLGSKLVQRFGRAQARLTLLDGRWEHIAGVSATDQDSDYRRNSATDSIYRGQRTKLDYQTRYSFDTKAGVAANHAVTVGIERESESVIAESAFVDVDRTLESDSAFAQYRLGLAERLYLTGGIRHDGNELFEDADTYSLSAAYLLRETGTRLHASYSTGVKNPTLFQLFGFTNTFQGNPNLVPSKTRGWDAGVEQEIADGRARIGATYFESRISDLIVGSGVSATNQPGTSKARGVEVGGTLALSADLDLAAAYTFTTTSDASGEQLVRRPRHTASASLAYRFLEDRADAVLSAAYVGKRRDWAYDAFWNTSQITLESYLLVSLAASYQVTERLRLNGRIENLLDEEYEEVFTYGTPGRAAYVGLTATF